jgi:aminopeptidase-like protein
MLSELQTVSASLQAADDALALMARMYPICRSITGDGVRRTLDLVEEVTPLERYEIPTGTAAFDWKIPREWNIRDAYIADLAGRRLVDFRAHNLHVVSYSVPVNRTMTLDELQPHLHSLPDQPDWIPYRTSYYNENWGFCLRHSQREALGAGPFRVVIDSDLQAGHLTYAESVVQGSTDGEALIYTHTCHPSLANDNLTGIAVAAALASALRHEQPRLTWRFIFGPGTIGSLTWLSRNEERLPHLHAGLVLGLLGDTWPLTYKRSRRGDTLTDRAAAYVLSHGFQRGNLTGFEPYGYDERQFCSPGFDLPIGRMTRASNAGYPEYHTSADDLSLIKRENLAGSIRAVASVMSVIDVNRRVVNLSPKGEPQLGKRGLYGKVGGAGPGEMENALLWVLSLADGSHDLLAMAERAKIPLSLIEQAARALEEASLVKSLACARASAPAIFQGAQALNHSLAANVINPVNPKATACKS